MTKSIKEQVTEAMDEVEAAMALSESERIAAIREEVEAQIQADKEGVDPLKIGERRYARVSTRTPQYVIVGAPRVGKERWVTTAPQAGGVLESFSEDAFRALFWEV